MLIKIEQPPKAEFSQVWVDCKDGVRLLIASSNKPSFNRALELNNMQAEQELQDMKLVTDDTAEGAKLAFNRAISHLLLDWTGIDSEPNKHFEYRKYGITTEHQRQQRKALGLKLQSQPNQALLQIIF
ncbi:hypothetical protein GCM10027155_07270 [Acinetobacter apis]|uniref:Uncharacterized protein n=1 Tax=Acinetobacter apis TaxID=1229165 RepID=A0A217EE62_9GAMM|nr:hypothetical protein [Acinetobacter apis]SNQ28809.1 hypothetical protein SAMN05444584_0736 [Acinetobacter apis]